MKRRYLRFIRSTRPMHALLILAVACVVAAALERPHAPVFADFLFREGVFFVVAALIYRRVKLDK